MVRADERDLVSVVHKQIQVVQDLLTVNDLCQTLDLKDVLTALPVGLESHIREPSA